MFTLGSIGLTLLSLVFIAICAFMILVILIQKPKGGGLSGAFGGAGGGSQAVFGAKVGDFLTWFTVTLFALFLLVAIVLVFVSRSEGQATNITPGTSVESPATPDTPATPEGEGGVTPTSEVPEAPATPDAPATPQTPTPPAPAE